MTDDEIESLRVQAEQVLEAIRPTFEEGTGLRITYAVERVAPPRSESRGLGSAAAAATNLVPGLGRQKRGGRPPKVGPQREADARRLLERFRGREHELTTDDFKRATGARKHLDRIPAYREWQQLRKLKGPQPVADSQAALAACGRTDADLKLALLKMDALSRPGAVRREVRDRYDAADAEGRRAIRAACRELTDRDPNHPVVRALYGQDDDAADAHSAELFDVLLTDDEPAEEFVF